MFNRVCGYHGNKREKGDKQSESGVGHITNVGIEHKYTFEKKSQSIRTRYSK